MHRTFLALTIAALASFATAVHADDSAAARSNAALPHAAQSRSHEDVLHPHRQMRLANVFGNGEIDKPCHADRLNEQGGTDHIYCGKYAQSSGDLGCQGVGLWINCHKDSREDPPKATCWDGNDEQMCPSR